MITKYIEYIKESLSTKTGIKNWLDEMNIKNYTINKDLTVDVDGDVNINNKNLKKIPVKFNKIDGNFYCSYNILTSLEGCPTNINGDFNCSNNKLTSLEYCPTTINGGFSCIYNNLTSLEGCLSVVDAFYCSNNKLISLKGCPKIVSGKFRFSDNPLEDINDLDSKILIKNIRNIEASLIEAWDKYIEASIEAWNKYFEHWIDKDINILEVLKDKISDKIKTKYDYLFNAKNFDLI